MKVAITGIIGSGKSEVSKIVATFGATVLSADTINKELLQDVKYQEKLKEVFPDAFPCGKFDKKKLTDLVFGDKEKLSTLNSIAHPEIMKKMHERAEGYDLVFCEIPLLKEDWAKDFDRIWLVKCDDNARVERICARDNRSLDEALKIIDSQRAYKDIKYDNCDIIYNNGNFEELKEKVEKLYCELSVKRC